MKTKILLIPAVVGLFVLTSCSHAPSPEALKEIGDFEAVWGELGTKATAWSQELKVSVDSCTAACTRMDAAAASLEGVMNDEAKAKMDPLMSACKNDKAMFEAMWGEWTSFETTWAESSKSFGEWKEKVMKGEVKGENVSKGLTEYKAKMEEANAKLASWSAAYTTAKETCMHNMTACMDAGKMMAEEASKGKKKS